MRGGTADTLASGASPRKRVEVRLLSHPLVLFGENALIVRMSQINLYVALVVGIIFVGIASYVFWNKQSNLTTNETPLNSVEDFINLVGAQQCSYVGTGEFRDSRTIFVADRKLRGDLVLPTESETAYVHFLVSDDTAYVWADGGAPQGTKFSVMNMGEKEQSQMQLLLFGEGPSTDNVIYSCVSWVADESKFAMPGIIFYDLE